MSTMALGMPLPVSRSMTLPCIQQTLPWWGDSMMEPPFSRKGASGDQKGPRMEDEVGMLPDSEACL